MIWTWCGPRDISVPSPRKEACSRERSGSTQNHPKAGLQFSLFSSKRSQPDEEFWRARPIFPRQERIHTIASYRHILIYAHVFLGFSNSEDAPPFFLYPNFSTRTSPSMKGSFSHSLANIWGGHKGCAQSLPQIKALHDKFPSFQFRHQF